MVSGSPTTTSCCCSTPPTSRSASSCPGKAFGDNWVTRLDTATGSVDPVDAKPWKARSKHRIEAHSVVVLSSSTVPEAERVAAADRANKGLPTIAKAAAPR